MDQKKRQKYRFAFFLLTGIGFNLSWFFGRELYNALFIFWPILVFFLGGTFLGFLVWARYRKRRDQHWRLSIIAFGLITPFVLFYNPEWFRANTILRARLIDDLSYLDLRIREDGSCTTEATGMFIFSWVYHGQCEVDGRTVLFHEPPYNNDFFPNQAAIIGDKLIIRYRDGKPDTSFASYFEISYRSEETLR